MTASVIALFILHSLYYLRYSLGIVLPPIVLAPSLAHLSIAPLIHYVHGPSVVVLHGVSYTGRCIYTVGF